MGGPRPLLAALVCTGVALGQVADLAHALTAFHASCPEHAGEIVELSRAETAQSHAQRGPRAKQTGPLVVSSGARSNAEGHHDHCPVTATGSARLLSKRPLDLRPLASAASRILPQIAAPPVVLAPLIVAPKCSPPSAA
jgi:hypothetical protein